MEKYRERKKDFDMMKKFGLNKSDIARHFRISRERVQQIEEKEKRRVMTRT